MYAVEIKEGHLQYGSGSNAFQALNGVNLRVPKGSIYGLLGPSGCGKTTLLNCLVGKRNLTSGSVRVFGNKPGHQKTKIPGRGVGFMPQEIALYPEFTIAETLRYYGSIYQMKRDEIAERIAFLLEFLDLPEGKRLVKKLSGGQQRRVSLAASIIHRPPLLILDEPTVGVDPLIRQNIWDYLVEITKTEGTTIIITTHYIEEAKQANAVGFMRGGRLLAEGTPYELMETFRMSSLEDCFLELCKLDKETKKAENSMEVFKPKFNKKKATVFYGGNMDLVVPGEVKITFGAPIPHYSIASGFSNVKLEKQYSVENKRPLQEENQLCCGFLWMFFTLLFKNYTLMKRNIPLLLFQFAIPSIQLILLCLCIGLPPFHIFVAVVNEEFPVTSSFHFLKQIDNTTIVQIPFSDRASAIESVQKGETWGVLNIQRNFSTCLMKRVLSGLDVQKEVVSCGSVELKLDMSNQQVGFTIETTVMLAFKKFAEEMLSAMGRGLHITDSPITVSEPIYGAPRSSYTEFIAPAVLLSITFIMAVGLTAMSLVNERKSGLFDRSWVAGVTISQVLSSHVVTQFLVIVIQITGLFVFTFLVFAIPSQGPFVWVVVLTLLQGLCGMCYGLVISCLVDDEASAIMLSLGSFYPNLILSGVVWPIEGMPFFMRYVSYCLPQTLPIESVRAILSRGWGIDYTIVWSGILVSIFWIILFLSMTVFIFKIRNK